MSDNHATPGLDPCGCCAGDAPREAPANAPGLPALRYRLSTHAGFLARMLHALPRAEADADLDARPLAALTARSSEDPTVALLDACACAADVLTFYQERLANEGFLRTATERRSVLELARAIGYELSPGVAAAAHLAITVEDAPGAPGESTLPKATQVQSVPPQGKLPQVFETSAEFTARAEWNALRPRLTRPAELAVLTEGVSPPGKRLVLVGPHGSFPAGTPGLVPNVSPQSLRRLEPAEAAASGLDALEVRRVYFTEAAADVAKGELLLFAGKEGVETDHLVLRVSEAALEVVKKPDGTPDPERTRMRVDLEPLPEPASVEPPPPALKRVPYLLRPFQALAAVRLAPITFDRPSLVSTVVNRTWRERDLRALVGIQGWHAPSLVRAINIRRPGPPITLETGAFSFREKVAFFGHNAPKWKSLPKEGTVLQGNPYPKGWDAGDGTLTEPRRIWTDSQGDSFGSTGPHAYLERAVGGVVQKSWVVLESPEERAAAYAVYDAREASRADYGLSGKATALVLADKQGRRHHESLPDFFFRTTTARVSSRRLELAELPIEAPVERGATAIELDRMVLGLSAGQPVAFRGERSDLPGVEVAEIAVLADVIHAEGRTTLVLRTGLQNAYVRDKLTISANVVPATHGETTHELLGNGDGSIANQRFTLKKPPLTYVSAPTPRGSRSTLELRVNGVLWDEVPSLYGLSPGREAYVIRTDDESRAHVVFGDGEQGARLPSGAANVGATYRSGIGPDGEVEPNTLTVLRAMPLGLRSLTNPVAASGAEGPESLDDARRNAPLTVLTFERVVSLTDYEDLARTFSGIGKALADLLRVDGRNLVHLTVGGATGKAADAQVLENLVAAIQAASDGAQPFAAASFAQRYFTCRARVVVNPRYVPAAVLSAVEERLKAAFAFAARQFGQSVTAAEVVALMQSVEGVVAVDLDSLAPYDDAAPPPPGAAVPGSDAVPARRARWNPDSRTVEPAELLLINPVGIELTVMKP